MGPRVAIPAVLGAGGALLFPGGPIGLGAGLLVGGIVDGVLTLFAPAVPAKIASEVTVEEVEEAYTPLSIGFAFL